MVKKVVEIKDLNYRYPDGIKALNNINIDVCDGECVGLIGANGAGKSTLLLHLNGVLRGNGVVRVDDVEVTDKTLKQVRSKVGLVFQDADNQLFMPTVAEDVAFGPINMGLSQEQRDIVVNQALKDVDMQGFESRLSHHLSFGEKKRVAIATVLSMNPQVLVMDEPSSNLDPKHRRDLINFIKESDITKIIASHDLDLVLEVCSRVVLLSKGEVVADGASNEILNDKILLEEHGLELPYSLWYNHRL